MAAADAWARGRPHVPPPSLRVLTLARLLRGAMNVDPLADTWEFFRELECYADAERAEKSRQAKAASERASRAGRGKGHR